MDNKMLINCDWNNCGSFAATHVRYGYSPYPDRAPAVGFHGDYCWRHTGYIEEYFTNTERVPIGKCPDECGFGGMRVVNKVTEFNGVGISSRQ
ncbi:MAG TPA: hypothetical protein VHQ01_11565 [Pyrinomonadaceae bacterium]|nr:hypothetical protein [Pyrinomonadaceae bacterium]